MREKDALPGYANGSLGSDEHGNIEKENYSRKRNYDNDPFGTTTLWLEQAGARFDRSRTYTV